MMEKVSNKVLKQNRLTGEDIDMLVVGTLTPEYLSPPTSTVLHNRLGIKLECLCYDLNVCCLTMSVAVAQVQAMMKANKNLKNVLIVSNDFNRRSVEGTDIDGLLGDLACAMIIEQTEEEGEDFLIDYTTVCYSYDKLLAVIPNSIQGLFGENYKVGDCSVNLEANPHADWAVEKIPNILAENNLTIDDISMFCLSQFAYANTETIRKGLNIPEEKSLYVADQYGYTSGNSPFLVLYKAIEQGKVKCGDYIFVWTVGAGNQQIYELIKY